MKLQEVILGERDADLVVRGGEVFRAEKGEFAELDVVVDDGKVACVRADASDFVGERTDVVDASGSFVVPGFIDAHTHVDLHQSFETAYPYYLEGGTTSVISESSGYGGILGPRGVEGILDAASEIPIDLFVTVPPQSFFDTFEDLGDDERDGFLELISNPRVVGVGETDWVHVVGRSSPVEELYDEARERNKRIEGHGAGCKGEKLDVFASLVDDDHEAVTKEGVVERLEKGLHVIGRYGSIRDDLEPFVEAYLDSDAPSEFSLSTDGTWPEFLVEEDGHMSAVVRRVVELGVEPVDALRMATLNPARHFGLGNRGRISPGSFADLVVLDDLEEVAVDTVIKEGEVVVDDGDAAVEPRPYDYPDFFYSPTDIGGYEFGVSLEGRLEDVDEIVAIECDEGLVSRKTTFPPRTETNEVPADPDRDIAKVALIDARSGRDKGFTGFLKGFGLRYGAVATTATWEMPGVLVVGTSDDAMEAAAERLEELGGGWVVTEEKGEGDKRVVYELATPVAGLCTDRPVEETAKAHSELREKLFEAGVSVDRPLLTLQTLSFPGVPTLKMSFSGYADILGRKIIGLDGF